MAKLQTSIRMYSKSSYRPRRTRIYGANYDIGESYYKRALDTLDSKSKTIRFADTNTENTDNSFSKREGRALSEISYPQLTAFRNYEEEESYYNNSLVKADSVKPKRLTSRFGGLQQEVTSSIKNADLLSSINGSFMSLENARNNRIKGNEEVLRKNKLTSMETTSNIMQKETFETDNSKKKSIIRTSKRDQQEDDNLDTSAFLRAKATKTRLANLESEMMELSEKQNEREKRNVNLKKLLSETI